ncbi:MAG: FecR family protein [Verrucomicrobiota bacterium]
MNRESEEQIVAWTARYLADDLDGAELNQLNAALEANPEACAVFDEVSQQAYALSEPLETGLTERQPIRFPRRIVVAAIGIAAAILAMVVIFTRPPAAAEDLARLITNEPASQLLNESGDLVRKLSPDEATTLQAGQGVRLDTATSNAEISFPDGTRISIAGHAEIRVGRSATGGKRVSISSGQIEAEVTKQPSGKPLVIATPTSKIEVLGTRLEVNASSEETLLAVTSGRVALIRNADGARVEVPAGRQTRSTKNGAEPLIAVALPIIPDAWEAEFDRGLPEGWRCGKWLSKSGAVLAHPNPENGFNQFSISSSNAWNQGHHSHFQIHPDSVLYLRFRMEKPEWFFLMLNLRATPQSARKHGGNVFYQSEDWHGDLEPDEWRTLRIPLRDFDKFRKGEFQSQDVDLAGLAAYSVYLTTQKRDQGLEVDSIRVVREP